MFFLFPSLFLNHHIHLPHHHIFLPITTLTHHSAIPYLIITPFYNPFILPLQPLLGITSSTHHITKSSHRIIISSRSSHHIIVSFRSSHHHIHSSYHNIHSSHHIIVSSRSSHPLLPIITSTPPIIAFTHHIIVCSQSSHHHIPSSPLMLFISCNTNTLGMFSICKGGGAGINTS